MIRSDLSVEFCVGDYFTRTRRLTLEQHGAHLVLTLSMVANGGALSFDDIALVLGDWEKNWLAICHLYVVDGEKKTITIHGLVEQAAGALGSGDGFSGKVRL